MIREEEKRLSGWLDVMKGPLTQVQMDRHKLLENRQWYAERVVDLAGQHPNKWVAVCDQQLAVIGDSYDEVEKAVRGKWTLEQALIMKVPFSPEAIYTPV